MVEHRLIIVMFVMRIQPMIVHKIVLVNGEEVL